MLGILTSNRTLTEQALVAGVSSRDSRLDVLRGLLLILMTIDHLPFAFKVYTYESLGFFGAAEGFIFLSGILAGKVYGAALGKGVSSVWRKALKKSVLLYGCHLLTFFLLLISIRLQVFPSGEFLDWAPLFYQSISQSILLGLVFMYRPEFMDVLPVYCVFLLAIPSVMIAFRKNLQWMVMMISMSLWMFVGLGGVDWLLVRFLHDTPVKLGVFSILAWQFLFLLGVYAGTLSLGTSHKWRGLLTTVCLLITIVCVVSKYAFLGEPAYDKLLELSHKGHLGPLRLVNFLAFSYLVYRMVTLQSNWDFRPLSYLGRHSLPVFTVHVVIVYLAALTQVRNIIYESWLLAFVAILGLYLPAFFFEKKQRSGGLRQVLPVGQ